MKISADELLIGTQLPCDVRGSDHTLLLRRGWILTSEKERDILLSRDAAWHSPAPELVALSNEDDLYVEGGDLGNPFDIYTFLCVRLNRVLGSGRDSAGLDGYIFDVVKVIRDSLGRHRNAMLSNIMLGDYHRYSIRHSVDTAILVEEISAEVGMPPIARNSLVAAALTMNVSMLEMQDRLHVISTPLPNSVRAIMKTHPERSHAMLQAAGVRDTRWLGAVRDHHERLDGSGYPKGVSGPAVSLEAQYVAVADSLLAMLRPSAYRAPEVPSKVFSKLYELRGKEFLADAVSAAIKTLGIYPIGTLVRLKNGEIAVVTAKGDNMAKPRVKSVTGELGMPRLAPLARDTGVGDYEIISVIDPARAGIAINRRQLF
jgi:HD-GYP domain-containing protein (c-di-GMP phosphodiesterase class II)